MNKFEKIVISDIPQALIDEMEKIGFGAGTKEVLKTAYDKERTKKQIEDSTKNFYFESGTDVEVKIVDNPEDQNSVFVFIKDKDKK